MPRLPAALALLLALAGCDSDGTSRDLERIQGTYTLESLVFDPTTQALPDADVGARLDLDDSVLQVFGDGEAQIVAFFEDDRRSQRTGLTVEATGSRAAFEAVTDEDVEELARLLLPPSFTLRYEGEEVRVLEGEVTLTGVDLQAFDPTVYQDQRSNRGTLTVRFRRP